MGFYEDKDRDIPVMPQDNNISEAEYNDILGIEDTEDPNLDEDALFEDITLSEETDPKAKKKKLQKKEKTPPKPLPDTRQIMEEDIPSEPASGFGSQDTSPLRQQNTTNHSTTPQGTLHVSGDESSEASPEFNFHGVHVVGIDSIDNIEGAINNGDLSGVSFGDATIEDNADPVATPRTPKGFSQPLSNFTNASYASNDKMEELFSGFGPINRNTTEDIPYLVNGATFNNTYKTEFATATAIVFAESTEAMPSSAKIADLSADQSGRILAWQEGETMFVAPATANMPLMANPDSAVMFANSENLKSIDFGVLRTEQVVSMNSMLANCYDLQSVNLESLKVDSVVDLGGLLANCENIQKADISNWKLREDVDATAAFSRIPALEQENIENLWPINQQKSSITPSSLFEGYRYDLTAPISVGAIQPVSVYEKIAEDGTPYLLRGNEFNSILQQLDNKATQITFTTEKVPQEIKGMDVSADHSGRIMAWTDGDGIIRVSTGDPTMKLMANPDSANMFSNNSSLKSVDFGNLDTSKITQATGAFYNTPAFNKDAIPPIKLEEAILATAFESPSASATATPHTTTKILPDLVEGKLSPEGNPYILQGAQFNTIFKQEFSDATEVVFSSGKAVPKDIKAIDITANNSGQILMWKEKDIVHISTTSESVKPLANPDSSNMFSGLFSLQKIDLGTLDSSRTRDMANMFANSINLSSINTEKLKLDRTTDISGMFMNLSNIEKLNVANWNTDNIRHMIGTFKGTGVADLDVSKWRTDKTVDMTGTFAEMKNIRQLNLSSWNVSNVKQMNYMFANNDKLISLATDSWKTTRVEQMDNMFLGNKSLTNFNPATLKTDSLQSMNGIFIGATSLNKETAIQWTEKASLAIEKNNLAANAKEILRKMTPEERTKFALELETNKIAKDSYAPNHVIDFAKKNNIGPYKEPKSPNDKKPSPQTEKGFANNQAGINSPFAKAKEDEIDKIVNQRQNYKFVTEKQHVVRHTFSRSGQKLGNVAKAIVTNNLYDDDQYKVATTVGDTSRTISSAIVAAGGQSIFNKAKNIARDTQFAAFNTDKLIQDGVITVGDLKKSKKDVREILNQGLDKAKINLSQKELESILRNRHSTYDLYMVRQNINERVELGQFSQMSDSTKRALKDVRFTKLYSKEMHEAFSIYGNTSKNPIMKRINILSNKDIDKVLRNAKKYGLTETDKSVLRLKKAQNKLKKARLGKQRLSSGIFSAFRALSDVRRMSDSTFAEGASILYNSIGIASSSKSVIFAGVKAGRYGIKLVSRGGKKFLSFVDRKTGATIAIKKGAKAIERAALNSAPGRAVNTAIQKGTLKVQKSKVGKATKSSTDKIRKYKERVREKRRQRAVQVAEKKAASAVARLQAKAAVRRAMNSKVGKAVSLPLKILAAPFKGLGTVSKALSVVIKGAQKLIYGALSAVGIFIICYILLVLIISALLAIFEGDSTMRSSVMSDFVSANQASNSSITAEQIAASEAEEHRVIQNMYSNSKYYQEELLVTAKNVAEGRPLNPTVYCGHTISRYGSPNASGVWTPGSTFLYVDADGEIVVATIDNTKDAVVMAYILMNGNFFTDSAGRDALVKALYEYMNPVPIYEESAIYYCARGCDSMTYHCNNYSEYSAILNNDNNGMSAYSSYSYRSNGDYYTTSCNGHTYTSPESDETTTFYHSGGFNSSPSYAGSVTLYFSDGSTSTVSPGSCSNYSTNTYCNAHTVPVCYGHKNITITVQKRTMYNLFEDGYSLPSNYSYNSYLNNFTGWTEEYKTWATTLKGADWYELYGVGN